MSRRQEEVCTHPPVTWLKVMHRELRAPEVGQRAALGIGQAGRQVLGNTTEVSNVLPRDTGDDNQVNNAQPHFWKRHMHTHTFCSSLEGSYRLCLKDHQETSAHKEQDRT